VPQVRNEHFDIRSDAVTAWRAADPAGAAFFDSLSCLFPQGERFFISAVQHFRGHARDGLRQDVSQFIGQEAVHTREHAALNAVINDAGERIAPLEQRTAAELDRCRKRPPLHQLAITVALEHFTATLAHHLITEPAYLRHAPADIRRLWRWHAGEEIEHKAVAFDLLATVMHERPPAWRYALRTSIYLETLARLARVAIPNYVALCGGSRFRALRALAAYLLGRPGLLRRMFPDLLIFLRPGFHPWQIEDAHLVDVALAS
jgi:predicted metal-dependent hydrolase